MASGKVFKYAGDKATVSWHGGLCIHIGECGRAKGELFVAGRKPWCQPDSSSDDEIEDGSHVETADSENTVHVAYNGPLFLRGDLDIDDAPDSAPGLKFRAALCRCGLSGNKPYCDNSHEKHDFQDYGAVGETGDENAPRGGALKVQALKDGPLVCKGNVTIFNSSGRESFHGSQAVLCRCGASNNKPFCDGQHKKVGFKSD